jgi:hypothetical protein
VTDAEQHALVRDCARYRQALIDITVLPTVRHFADDDPEESISYEIVGVDEAKTIAAEALGIEAEDAGRARERNDAIAELIRCAHQAYEAFRGYRHTPASAEAIAYYQSDLSELAFAADHLESLLRPDQKEAL